MYTNNNLERTIVNQLIERDFQVDFNSIILTSSNQIEYVGKGTLFIRDGGQFYLKFLNDCMFNQHELSVGMVTREYGMDKDFSMRAISGEGIVYTCEHLISREQILNTGLLEVNAKIFRESNFNSNPKIIFYGKYNLPLDKISTAKTKVVDGLLYTENQHIWIVELYKGLSVIFSQFNKYTEALFVGEKMGDVTIEFANIIVSTFDFITGNITQPLLIDLPMGGQYIFNIRLILEEKSMFPSPLPMKHNRNVAFTINHTNLFRAYFNFINDKQGQLLPIIHKRIISSSKGYLFAMGLMIAIQIENICKEYYSHKYVKDDIFLEKLKKSIDLLTSADKIYYAQVIEELYRKFPSNNKASLNTKNILRNISKEGLFENALVKVWSDLRNKTTHGVNVSGDDWDMFLHKTFICSNLYYILIYKIIGYRGIVRYYKDAYTSEFIKFGDNS